MYFRFAFLLFCSSVVSAISLPHVIHRSGSVRTETIELKRLDQRHQYSLLYSLSTLRNLGQDARVDIRIVQDGTTIAGKVLHAGDPDFYTQFRVLHAGPVSVRVQAVAAHGEYVLDVNAWPLSNQVKSGPDHRWQDAMPIPLGKTVFASGDDTEYIPVPGTSRRAIVEDPNGTDWYRFDFPGGSTKLVFFQIELMERDQLPVNVSVYRLQDGKLVEYFDGEDPVALPHEVQALPGNKFTPRLLNQAGTYYVAVRASHPEYKLRTRLYDPPPYSDPHQAVRTGSITFWPPAIRGTPTRPAAVGCWTESRAYTRRPRFAWPAILPTSRNARSFTRCATAIPWWSASNCSSSPNGSTTIRGRFMASKSRVRRGPG